MKISKILARQILDSKGDPTVEVELGLDNGLLVKASVPSGSSTGSNEVLELRDNEASKFGGLGVLKAVTNVNNIIAPALINFDPTNQKLLDETLCELDGTSDKSKLGANAILGVSMAACKAGAAATGQQPYKYIADLFGNSRFILPRPMILFLEGGKHGDWSTDIQEFMLMPSEGRFESFTELLNATHKIFGKLQDILKKKKYSTGVGFEGAFCPREISSNEEALEILMSAVIDAGFELREDFVIALDFASSEFFTDGVYNLRTEGKTYTPKEWSQKVINLAAKYPIFSLEDIHSEEAWDDWAEVNSQLGKDYQIVGDDLVTTNIKRINLAATKKAVNAVIIKLNQIGTVTETMEAVSLTKKLGWQAIVSHRGGETNDDFVVDFCIGTGSQQCKFGGISRGERVTKYNRLLFLEGDLDG